MSNVAPQTQPRSHHSYLSASVSATSVDVTAQFSIPTFAAYLSTPSVSRIAHFAVPRSVAALIPSSAAVLYRTAQIPLYIVSVACGLANQCCRAALIATVHVLIGVINSTSDCSTQIVATNSSNVSDTAATLCQQSSNAWDNSRQTSSGDSEQSSVAISGCEQQRRQHALRLQGVPVDGNRCNCDDCTNLRNEFHFNASSGGVSSFASNSSSSSNNNTFGLALPNGKGVLNSSSLTVDGVVTKAALVATRHNRNRSAASLPSNNTVTLATGVDSVVACYSVSDAHAAQQGKASYSLLQPLATTPHVAATTTNPVGAFSTRPLAAPVQVGSYISLVERGLKQQAWEQRMFGNSISNNIRDGCAVVNSSNRRGDGNIKSTDIIDEPCGTKDQAPKCVAHDKCVPEQESSLGLNSFNTDRDCSNITSDAVAPGISARSPKTTSVCSNKFAATEACCDSLVGDVNSAQNNSDTPAPPSDSTLRRSAGLQLTEDSGIGVSRLCDVKCALRAQDVAALSDSVMSPSNVCGLLSLHTSGRKPSETTNDATMLPDADAVNTNVTKTSLLSFLDEASDTVTALLSTQAKNDNAIADSASTATENVITLADVTPTAELALSSTSCNPHHKSSFRYVDGSAPLVDTATGDCQVECAVSANSIPARIASVVTQQLMAETITAAAMAVKPLTALRLCNTAPIVASSSLALGVSEDVLTATTTEEAGTETAHVNSALALSVSPTALAPTASMFALGYHNSTSRPLQSLLRTPRYNSSFASSQYQQQAHSPYPQHHYQQGRFFTPASLAAPSQHFPGLPVLNTVANNNTGSGHSDLSSAHSLSVANVATTASGKRVRFAPYVFTISSESKLSSFEMRDRSAPALSVPIGDGDEGASTIGSGHGSFAVPRRAATPVAVHARSRSRSASVHNNITNSNSSVPIADKAAGIATATMVLPLNSNAVANVSDKANPCHSLDHASSTNSGFVIVRAAIQTSRFSVSSLNSDRATGVPVRKSKARAGRAHPPHNYAVRVTSPELRAQQTQQQEQQQSPTNNNIRPAHESTTSALNASTCPQHNHVSGGTSLGHVATSSVTHCVDISHSGDGGAPGLVASLSLNLPTAVHDVIVSAASNKAASDSAVANGCAPQSSPTSGGSTTSSLLLVPLPWETIPNSSALSGECLSEDILATTAADRGHGDQRQSGRVHSDRRRNERRQGYNRNREQRTEQERELVHDNLEHDRDSGRRNKRATDESNLPTEVSSDVSARDASSCLNVTDNSKDNGNAINSPVQPATSILGPAVAALRLRLQKARLAPHQQQAEVLESNAIELHSASTAEVSAASGTTADGPPLLPSPVAPFGGLSIGAASSSNAPRSGYCSSDSSNSSGEGNRVVASDSVPCGSNGTPNIRIGYSHHMVAQSRNSNAEYSNSHASTKTLRVSSSDGRNSALGATDPHEQLLQIWGQNRSASSDRARVSSGLTSAQLYQLQQQQLVQQQQQLLKQQDAFTETAISVFNSSYSGDTDVVGGAFALSPRAQAQSRLWKPAYVPSLGVSDRAPAQKTPTLAQMKTLLQQAVVSRKSQKHQHQQELRVSHSESSSDETSEREAGTSEASLLRNDEQSSLHLNTRWAYEYDHSARGHQPPVPLLPPRPLALALSPQWSHGNVNTSSANSAISATCIAGPIELRGPAKGTADPTLAALAKRFSPFDLHAALRFLNTLDGITLSAHSNNCVSSSSLSAASTAKLRAQKALQELLEWVHSMWSQYTWMLTRNTRRKPGFCHARASLFHHADVAAVTAGVMSCCDTDVVDENDVRWGLHCAIELSKHSSSNATNCDSKATQDHPHSSSSLTLCTQRSPSDLRPPLYCRCCRRIILSKEANAKADTFWREIHRHGRSLHPHSSESQALQSPYSSQSLEGPPLLARYLYTPSAFVVPVKPSHIKSTEANSGLGGTCATVACVAVARARAGSHGEGERPRSTSVCIDANKSGSGDVKPSCPARDCDSKCFSKNSNSNCSINMSETEGYETPLALANNSTTRSQQQQEQLHHGATATAPVNVTRTPPATATVAVTVPVPGASSCSRTGWGIGSSPGRPLSCLSPATNTYAAAVADAVEADPPARCAECGCKKWSGSEYRFAVCSFWQFVQTAAVVRGVQSPGWRLGQAWRPPPASSGGGGSGRSGPGSKSDSDGHSGVHSDMAEVESVGSVRSSCCSSDTNSRGSSRSSSRSGGRCASCSDDNCIWSNHGVNSNSNSDAV